MKNTSFTLTQTPIEPQTLSAVFSDKGIGAIVTFEGRVRNVNAGLDVDFLLYEAEEELCRRLGNKILTEAVNRFELIDAKASHRIGKLHCGDLAVWLGVASPHRRNAFRAGEFIIDEIKRQLPVWKKEYYLNGSAEWLRPQHSLAEQDFKNQGQQYYERQRLCPQLGEAAQGQLDKARVLLIGAGGLGSSALTSLAQMGVGTIGICEYDKVEISNLHRQPLYGINDVGLFKLEAAIKRLQSINPFVKFIGINERAEADNIEDLSKNYDVIVDCTDNFESKFLLNDFAVRSGLPLIQAGVYQLEGFLIGIYPQKKTACLRCLWPGIPDRASLPVAKQGGVIGITPAVMGQLQALEVMKYLLDLPGLLAGKCLMVRLDDYTMRTLNVPRLKDCPACSLSLDEMNLSSRDQRTDALVR